MPFYSLCSTLPLIFCTKCSYVVNRKQWKSHLITKHGISLPIAREEEALATSILPNDISTSLADRYITDPFPKEGEHPLPRIAELPVVEAFKCPLCDSYFQSKTSLRAHVAARHQKENEENKDKISNTTPVMAQTLFEGPKRRLFPISVNSFVGKQVIPHEYGLLPSPLAGLAVEETESHADPLGEDEAAFEDRARNVIAKYLKVESFMRSKSLSCNEAYSLSCTEGNELEKKLLKAITSYLTLFASGNPLPLSVSSVADVTTSNGIIEINLNLKQDTRLRYSRHILRVFVTILRIVNDARLLDLFSISQGLCDAANSIKDVLEGGTAVPGRPDAATQVTENRGLGTHGIQRRPDILQAIHRLLKSLLLSNVQSSKGERIDLEDILRIIVSGFRYSHKEGRTRVADADDVSHIAAALQHATQICAIGEFLQKPHGFGPSDINGSRDEISRRSEVTRLLTVKDGTPTSFIRAILPKARKVASYEAPRIAFAPCFAHDEGKVPCGIVNNIEVPLNSQAMGSIGYAIRALQSEAMGMLRDHILLGFKMPISFFDTARALAENIPNKDGGFWFARHPNSQAITEEWGNMFATHVTQIDHPLFEEVSIDLDGNTNDSAAAGSSDKPSRTRRESQGNQTHPESAKVQWKHSKQASSWVQHVHRFTKLLFVLIHLSGGGPPRASELCTAKVRNSATGRRNVFLYKRKVVLALTYTKTADQFGGKPIARFVDANTAFLLLVYICILKPSEPEIFHLMYGGSSRRTCDDFLFIHNGNVSQENVYLQFFRKTMERMGIGFGVRLYRQYQAGVSKTFMATMHRGLDAMEINAFEEPVHRQAGHTETTARKMYAQNELDFDCMNTATVEAFLRVSELWHRMLGIPSETTTLQYVCPTTDASNHTTILNGTAAVVPVGRSCSTGRTAGNAPQIEGLIRNGISTGQLDTSQKQSNFAGHQPNASRSAAQKKPPGTAQSNVDGEDEIIQSTMTSVKPSDLSNCLGNEPASPTWNQLCDRQFWDDPNTCVSRFFGNSDVSGFKSAEQGTAVKVCFNAFTFQDVRASVLVVLPTGGGKSLTWMLPAAMMQKVSNRIGKSAPVLIVLVPVIALMQDLNMKAKSLGINVATWEERFDAGTSVIIASVDVIRRKEYGEFVMGAYKGGALAGIVVDEVHLLLMWNNFRNFSDVNKCIMPASVRTGLILLTATMPPTMESLMHEFMGTRQDTARFVVRAGTRRPNLKYMVFYPDRECKAVVDAFVDEGDDEDEYAVFSACVSICSAAWTTIVGSEGRIILYCSTRKDCYTICQMLSLRVGTGAVHLYHGALSSNERSESFEGWIRTDRAIMVATSAFGVGIDIPSVRAVIHCGGPKTVLDFVQESGRGGRDGKECKSTVVFSKPFWECRNRTRSGLQDEHSAEVIRCSGSFLEYADQTRECRRRVIHGITDGHDGVEDCSSNDSKCDVCVSRVNNSRNPRNEACQSIGIDKPAMQQKLHSEAITGPFRPEGQHAYNETIKESNGKLLLEQTQNSLIGLSNFVDCGRKRSRNELFPNDDGEGDVKKQRKALMGNVGICNSGAILEQPQAQDRAERDGKARNHAITGTIVSEDAALTFATQLMAFKCAVCLTVGRDSWKTVKNHNFCMSRRCFRCLEFPAKFGHKSATCEIIPRSAGAARRCSRCGILGTEQVHDQTNYGKPECPWQMVKDVMIILWRGPKKHQLIEKMPWLESITDVHALGMALCGTTKTLPKMYEAAKCIHNMYVLRR